MIDCMILSTLNHSFIFVMSDANIADNIFSPFCMTKDWYCSSISVDPSLKLIEKRLLISSLSELSFIVLNSSIKQDEYSSVESVENFKILISPSISSLGHF
eukprot:NODE_17_length_41373_cov_0.337016.p31 type:complete len:101 gc:universal NODE_17_length_41373_cov_0.337016:31382-31080(-)